MLFLWAENLDEVPLGDGLQPLVWIVFAATLASVVLGLVLGNRVRAALVVTPVVLGALLYGHVVELFDAPGAIHRLGWAGLVGIGALGAWRLGDQPLVRVDRALLGFGAVLVGFGLASIVPHQLEVATAAGPPDLTAGRPFETQTSAARRDVYWLVFDRYGSDRSLELEFGVRNEFTPWLREQGFRVLDDSHANYVATSLSMSTTLNMAHLEELTGQPTSAATHRQRVYAQLQAPLVARQFKAMGYTYHHLGSWWNPTRTDVAADANYNAEWLSEFGTVLFEKSALPTALRALGIDERSVSRQYKHGSFGLDTLDGLRDEPGPKFVMAHVLLPHPPYAFDRDGSFQSPPQARRLGETEAWHRQFDYLNARLRAFLEPLLALPEDEQPIIILQADEGPWIEPYVEIGGAFDWRTATPEQLEIKFGILNAWYVPGADLGLDPAMTAINTFPVLFSRYFGLDYETLPDRVAASDGWVLNYRLLDVTDRLPSLTTAGGQP